MRWLSVPLFVMLVVGCAGTGLPGDRCLSPTVDPECPEGTRQVFGDACDERDDCVSPGDDCTGDPILCVPDEGAPEQGSG